MKKFLVVLILSFLIPAQAHAIKYKGDLESNESVTLPEQGTTPANPSTGKKKVYVKSDGLHVLDSAGVDQFLNSFTAADEAKLDGIEAAATADQTNAEIKTAYEANADTNAFDDAEQSKLAGIAAGATKTEYFVGTFTRDTTLASGTQAITGVGFQPSAVIFFMGAGDNAINSRGFTDGTTDVCMYEGASQGQPDDAIHYDQGVGTYTGRIDAANGSLDADGFTVDWLKVSAPTLTLTIHYLALR